MLHFPGTSWGFSIVGGAEPGSDRSPEPVHVLFVVPESPAAKVMLDADDWSRWIPYLGAGRAAETTSDNSALFVIFKIQNSNW